MVGDNMPTWFAVILVVLGSIGMTIFGLTLILDALTTSLR
jgi:hypothetical protein